MKEQYVGDVSDYRKYALLRRIGEAGLAIGVCWMLTPPDDRPDGRKIGYLAQPKLWREFDPHLFDLLSAVVDAPDLRRLHLIEDSGIIPGAIYWNDVVPDARVDRERYFASALQALSAADLIFFDPDNGLDIGGKPKGRKNSSKFVFRDEIAATYQAGHSILIYQHFIREERRAFLGRVAGGLQRIALSADIWSLETAHVAFLLLAQPRHRSAVVRALRQAEAAVNPKMIRSLQNLSNEYPTVTEAPVT